MDFYFLKIWQLDHIEEAYIQPAIVVDRQCVELVKVRTIEDPAARTVGNWSKTKKVMQYTGIDVQCVER